MRRYFENIAIEEVVQEVVSTAPERVVKLATDIIVENVSTVQRMEPIINDMEKAMEKLKDANGNITNIDQYLDIADKLRHYYNMRAKLLGDLQPKTAFTQNNVIFYIPDNNRDTSPTG